ncbi:DUF2000 domain-containing protein [Photobacterium damselae]
MKNLPNEADKRFVAILNKKMDLGRTLNVLGHISVGLSNLLDPNDAIYIDYCDLDNNHYKNICHYPFIVLKADNSNKIRKLKELAESKEVKFTVFTHTMIDGGSEIQQSRTKQTSESELNYLGICLFGDTDVIKNLTKKFSLYK